jgi:hypothetical protein
MDDENYDLIETPEEDPIDLAPSGLIQDGFEPIDYDLSCRHCAYNLRGMTEDGACPECGTSVGRSLLGDQLRFSDPVWVRTLATGMTWIVWGFVLGILLAVALMILGFTIPNLDPYVISAIGSVSSLVMLVGYWKVTAPEPGVLEAPGMTLRSFVRWATVAGAVVSLTSQFAVILDPITAGVVKGIGGLIGMAGFLALFVYARRLALRVPDDSLAHQTRVVMWGLVSSLGVLIVSGVILAITASSSATPTPGMVAAVPMCMAGVGYLVFAIWSLVLVIWYHRVASAAAHSAEQTWARDI